MTPILVGPMRFLVQSALSMPDARVEEPWATFMWQLFRACRDDEMQSAGMPALPEALVRMQFAAQERSLRENYPGVERNVILLPPEEDAGREKGEKSGEAGVVPVGAFIVHWPASGSLRLVDIAFLPAFRGRGLGTAVIRGLQAEARTRTVPLVLSVAANNVAACRLYEGLGFRPTLPSTKEARTDLFIDLAWQDQTAA